MSTGNAIWLYDQSKVGDVVEVKNTGRKQDLGNGITEWNVKWAKWLARSKTGEQAVGPEPAAAKPAPAPAPAVATVSVKRS